MKKAIFLTSLILLIFSCKKDNVTKTPSVNDYFPMKIGNYWVYQEYQIDTNAIEKPLNYIDSIFISNDTIINGKTYFVFVTKSKSFLFPPDNLSFYRDSSGNLVTQEGQILLSTENFNDTLSRRVDTIIINKVIDTLFTLTSKMEKIQGAVSLPAGNFNNILDYRSTVIAFPNTAHTDTFYTDKYFARGVGKILHNFVDIGSGSKIELRLISYKIN